MSAERALAEAMLFGTTEQAVFAMQMQQQRIEMMMVGIMAKAAGDAYAAFARLEAERRQMEAAREACAATRRSFEEQIP